MSDLITWEWKFFAIAAMWGMILAIIYDALRILRRVIIHRKVALLAAEDILFWMFSGFAMFHVIFMVNDGVIRSFALMGFVIGSAMYQYTVSYYLVKYISKVIIFLKKMSIKIFINPLKILCKSITIRMIHLFEKIKEQRRLKKELRLKEKRICQEQKHKEEQRINKAGRNHNEKIRDKEEQRTKNKKTKAL